MAKGAAAKAGGNSRIRFVMFDADVAEGEIGQITQAIQNALRGPGQLQGRRAIPAALKAPEINGNADEVEDDFDQDEPVEFEVEPAPAARPPRAKRSPARTPNVIPLDMNAPTSLATFAQGKDDKSQHKKYLIAAAWLKEHRSIDAINEDHIYTCFRSMGWSTNIPDFGQPLRDLKHKLKYFEKTDAGYAINHLGLDYARKLGGGSNGTG